MMLTANYLLGILSGVIDDISISLEVEEVLFEILSDSELMINEDDIEAIKIVDNDLIYKGISYRYIDTNQVTDKEKLIEKKINELTSCYIWSKSLLGLKRIYSEHDHKYLVSSIVEGLDMFNLSKRLVKFSRKLKRQGYGNRYNEFDKLRSDYKSQGLIVAPNGRELNLTSVT